MVNNRGYRILHIIAGLWVGGAERGLVNLIRHANNDIFEHIIIAFEDGELKQDFLNLGIEPIILRKKEGHHLRFIFQIVRKFKQLKPNIVHCRNALPAVIYGGTATKMASLPLVVSIHGHTNFLKNNFRAKLYYRIQNCSDRVITVSNSIKNHLITSGGINLDKITVIHNGIDLTRIKPISSSRESKKMELGLSHSDLIVGCVGNLRPVKGHKYLIQSMPLILKKFSNVQFVLVGDGALRAELERLASEFNVKDKVIFLGYRKDVSELMPIFDIFVSPSLSEGLSNVILEAMVAKKPVVATNVGGNPEVIEDGKTGILVRPNDPQALGKALITLLDDKRKRWEMGTQGFLRVKQEFCLDKAVKKYEQVYLSLLNRP